MKDKYIITIDGPAGAGKTTIARTVARRLGFKYVDTGAMYRAVTLGVIEASVEFDSVPEIEELAGKMDIRIDFEDGKMLIFLNGREVSDDIRGSQVTENTSLVAAIPGVRYKLARLQRSSAGKLGRTVFEGRDMGSIVFPGADLKVYLDAGISERARRRWQELKDKGIDVDFGSLEEKIKRRDMLDESRGLAPLRVPKNAVIIDSTNLSIEDVVQQIVSLAYRDKP